MTGTPRKAVASFTVATVAAPIAVTSAATTLFAASTSTVTHARTIFNDSASAGPLFIKFGAAASATDFTVSLAAGGYYEMPQPLYVGLVTAATATTATARVTSY